MFETNVLNSLPVVRFNGSTDVMSSAYVSPGLGTLYVVCVPRGALTNNLGPLTMVGGQFKISLFSSNWYVTGTASVGATATTVADGTGYIIEAQVNSTSSLINVANAESAAAANSTP